MLLMKKCLLDDTRNHNKATRPCRVSAQRRATGVAGSEESDTIKLTLALRSVTYVLAAGELDSACKVWMALCHRYRSASYHKYLHRAKIISLKVTPVLWAVIRRGRVVDDDNGGTRARVRDDQCRCRTANTEPRPARAALAWKVTEFRRCIDQGAAGLKGEPGRR